MNGIIQRVDGQFTDDTLPRYYSKDNMLSKGTLFMFDFSKTDTYQSQAVGAITPGTALKNLVDGAPDASSLGAVSFTAGKGMKAADTSGTINLGQNYDLNALGNINFMLSAWIKFPSGGEANTNSYQRILGRNGITTPTTYMAGFDTGAGGNVPRFSVSNGTIQPTRAGAAQTLGTVIHIAGIMENNLMYLYINGVSQGAGIPITGPVYNYIGLWYGLGTTNLTIYRMSLENLSATGVTGATHVANEYARNNTGKFS